MDKILSGRVFNKKNSIMLCGNAFDIGTRVIRWDEKGGFNGYTKKRVVVTSEDRKTGQVRRKIIQGNRFRDRRKGVNDITQLFIHHSGGDGRNPSGMYETLYNIRGLSVQFAVEDDGRIYQFNDAVDQCFHAGKHNRISVGVECCLYPDAEKNPNYYSSAKRQARTGNLRHSIISDTIHGRKRKVFAFTEPQVEALARLAAGTMIAVHIEQGRLGAPLTPLFPRDASWKIPRTVFNHHMNHLGMIGHLQCTKKKWDPAGFPWEKFEDRVGKIFWRFSKKI